MESRSEDQSRAGRGLSLAERILGTDKNSCDKRHISCMQKMEENWEECQKEAVPLSSPSNLK